LADRESGQRNQCEKNESNSIRYSSHRIRAKEPQKEVDRKLAAKVSQGNLRNKPDRAYAQPSRSHL
jgi:hypothetical protein